MTQQFHPEYAIDGNHNKKSVLLPIREWKKILLAMEELEDIRAYDKAKEMDEEVIPFEQAVEEIENIPPR
uniref:Antitoxin Phd_YefM, type II toxin-antitoxin system n=1 Tax=Candidatus Kentrum sp. SD TaxID=2126332 RepID=A0A450Z287_9GAMM|nr:MAG: hypothetical protein BECKSD772F_GA0070984_11125 [Candidatus Kentron sp. SD]VFK47910.1 MAG: hypothetical protein BECKSD772E_GA0070983_11095 [Candidatus Kentron sp. SD]VFK77691.1 MAG: hypothetical protein BECKSD772D_GA0070982_100120 [Candidatus Kentron sp. SD]